MKPNKIIATLNALIDTTFNHLSPWLAKDIGLQMFRPETEDRNISQILEHISLSNRYLLILIGKGRSKALHKAGQSDFKKELWDYQLTNPGLEQIGINNSFVWISPKHMIPTGEKTLSEIQEELMKQKDLLHEHLSMLANGQGVLHKISMSVNSLGRLDVYQYIYFLVKHIQRHIQQMEQIESEYERGFTTGS